MKIVIITYYFEPRLGYQEPNLARELAKLGHDVYVVTSNRRCPRSAVYKCLSNSFERVAQQGFFIEEGIKVIRLKTRFELFSRTWLKGLENTIVRLKPDVVEANGMTRFSTVRLALLKARRREGFKLIFDEHMVYSVVRNSLLGKIFYLLFRLIIRPLLLRQTDTFVAITEETKVFMNKECGIPLPRIEVIPLGVNHHLFKHDQSSKKELRNRYNLSESDVLFIYAGKIIPDKGPHLLVDAGLRLCGRHVNLKIFFLGDGRKEYINRIKDKIKQNGFGDSVIWHESVDNKELYKIYSAADVGVWPLQESITMLEASSCSLPIIIKDSLSLRDCISNTNGFGYEEANIEDLAKKMERLLIDKELRNSMGRNGRELVEKRLNWEAIAKRYVELYLKRAF